MGDISSLRSWHSRKEIHLTAKSVQHTAFWVALTCDCSQLLPLTMVPKKLSWDSTSLSTARPGFPITISGWMLTLMEIQCLITNSFWTSKQALLLSFKQPGPQWFGTLIIRGRGAGEGKEAMIQIMLKFSKLPQQPEHSGPGSPATTANPTGWL